MGIKDIVDKLSSYNLFNYLFPGFLFFVILKISMGWTDTVGLSLIEEIVLVYFSGLVLSRIGSLFIEGVVMKKCTERHKFDYKGYFSKSKDNIKLEIIFEAMNMYRTLSAMSLALMIIYSINTNLQILANEICAIKGIFYTFSALFLFVLFAFAFCRQREKVIECLKDQARGEEERKDPSDNVLSEEIGEILKSLKNYLNK